MTNETETNDVFSRISHLSGESRTWIFIIGMMCVTLLLGVAGMVSSGRWHWWFLAIVVGAIAITALSWLLSSSRD